MLYKNIPMAGFSPDIRFTDVAYLKTKENFIEWLIEEAQKSYGHTNFINPEIIDEEWKIYLDFNYSRTGINPPPLKLGRVKFTEIDCSITARSESIECECGHSVALFTRNPDVKDSDPLQLVLWQCDGCEQFYLRKGGRLYKVKGISAI